MGPEKNSFRELCTEIVRLRKGLGIFDVVRRQPGPRVAAMAHIEERDPAKVVSAKLLSLLTNAVAGLPNEKLREIAVVELNLRGENKCVVDRRKEHHALGGPSVRTSSDTMKLDIVPELARILISDSSKFNTA